MKKSLKFGGLLKMLVLLLLIPSVGAVAADDDYWGPNPFPLLYQIGKIVSANQNDIGKQRELLAPLGISIGSSSRAQAKKEFGNYPSMARPYYADRSNYFTVNNPAIFEELKAASRKGVGIDSYIDAWGIYKLTFGLATDDQFHVITTKGSNNAHQDRENGTFVGTFFNDGHVRNTTVPTNFFIDIDFFINRRFAIEKLKANGFPKIDVALKDVGVDYTIYLVMLALGYDPSVGSEGFFRKMSKQETAVAWQFEFNRNLQFHHEKTVGLTSGTGIRMPVNDLDKIRLAQAERKAYLQIGNALEVLSQGGDVVLVEFNAYSRAEHKGDLPEGLMSVADYDEFIRSNGSRRTLSIHNGKVNGITVDKAFAAAVAYVLGAGKSCGDFLKGKKKEDSE